MRTQPTARIGLVEDHDIVSRGIAALLETAQLASVAATTVADILAVSPPVDLVILDLRLADGSRVADNVAQIRAAGINVLVLTAGESVDLVRDAARTDVLGIVRKSEPEPVVLDAVRMALRGERFVSLEWAAAVEADPLLADAGLTPREREILSLYASGETAHTVADLTGLTPGVVANYVHRIRAKYAAAGRPAPSRVELYHRAVEDHIVPAPQ